MVLTTVSSKNVWRAKMLESRSQVGPDKASEFNRSICKNLSFVWSEVKPEEKQESKATWAGYKSFRWEADPELAIFDSLKYIDWVYPRVLNETDMEFRKPSSTDSNWLKNRWGLWEPDPRTSEKADLHKCVGVLVPAVAFDRQGHRLGYGKGFYDKALAGFTGLKVGVGFSVQVIEGLLPCEEFDVRMDLIVTDQEIIRMPALRH
jgi:5,10-methenyltetrahydrofolate synthetase